jgi:hypothetical protein
MCRGGIIPSVWREGWLPSGMRRRRLASLPLRTPAPLSITGRVGTSRAWARDTSSRDMAFPSSCLRGPSRGLHPRASLTLLYPSLCRMSSPSEGRDV